MVVHWPAFLGGHESERFARVMILCNGMDLRCLSHSVPDD